jgi:uncharacterized protein YndB with AHSA1/START domain
MNTALDHPTTASDPFIITRTFDAPRDEVWRAWTERDRLITWLGPKSVTIKVAKLDLLPTGTFHYGMLAGDGSLMWGKLVYREIVAPERIVFESSSSNEAGDVVRVPFRNQTWPLRLLATITLAEQHGKTALHFQVEPLDSTAAERQTFDSMRDAMRDGWTSTFDQLTSYLITA